MHNHNNNTKFITRKDNTYDFSCTLKISNPQTVCLKALTIRLAISFSIGDKITGNRTSNPSLSRFTLPSTTGDLRASACP